MKSCILEGTAASTVPDLDFSTGSPFTSTIPNFLHLPMEIRLKIWKAASMVTRNVYIAVGDIFMSFKLEGEAFRYPHNFQSFTPIPSILHVSREARTEAQKNYKLAFETRTILPIIPLTISAPSQILHQLVCRPSVDNVELIPVSGKR
jgi:hypothetical protein